jgi:hypothetical protein
MTARIRSALLATACCSIWGISMIDLLPAVEVVPVLPAVLFCGLFAAPMPWSLRGGAMPPAGSERPERDWQARRADRHA